MQDSQNVLGIVPPYFTSGAPPLGPAMLLAYLRANGHNNFDFVDFRLWVPNAYAPTYRASGVFAETYVMDIPDLPIILGIINNFKQGNKPLPDFDQKFNQFCLERAINAAQLRDYLIGINQFLESSLKQFKQLKFIGFSTWSSNFHSTLMAAAHLKKSKNPPLIVLGGPQTTESEASAKLALRSGLADFVVLGEGEETLLQLYEAFLEAKGIPEHEISGTMRYNPQSNRFETTRRPLLRLTQLPLPAFDKMPFMAYQRRHTSNRVVTYELSRGCTDKCVFCSEWVFWEKIRVAKIEQVVEGMVQLQKDYHCDVVWFMDSLLNANVKRLRELAEEILRRQVKVKWGGYLRANMNQDTAKLLKQSGCEFAFVGVESLSDETLDLMRKRRSGAENIDALNALIEGGIDRVVAGFIPGFPGDTRARFTTTALMLGDIHDNHPEGFRVNIEPFTVSPMQPMYAKMKDYGLSAHAWSSDYLDIASDYQDICKAVYCSVDGSNQGIDRLGEIRIAQAITAAAPVEPDPFLYYEGEKVCVSQLSISDIADGWSMALMKTDHSLIIGFILSQSERLQYAQLEKLEIVGYGYGYGRKPQSSLLLREPFSSFLESIAANHIVPPSMKKPLIGIGNYLKRPIKRQDKVSLSPFVVIRMGLVKQEKKIIIIDVVCNKWHIIEAKWEWLFKLLSAGSGELEVLLTQAPEEPEIPGAAVALEAGIEHLIELGILWASPEKDHELLS